MKVRIKRAFQLGYSYHSKMNAQFMIIEEDLKNILDVEEFHVLHQMRDGIVICVGYQNYSAERVYEKYKELGRKLKEDDLIYC